MITTKRLMGCWIALGIATALGYAAHDVLWNKALEAHVKRGPVPIDVTDDEAVQWDYEFCKKNPQLTDQLVKTGGSCETLFANPTPEVVRASQQHYRSDHMNQQGYHEDTSGVWDQVENLNTMLQVFYFAVSISALVVFALWFKSTLLPRLVAVKDVVQERTPSASDIKALGANRKVRQAESDFQTLKNLHDNGLINDEMFEKRKAELREALSANKVFQD